MTKQPINFLRIREVQKRTALSRSTIYLLIKKGEFPKTISLTSGRSVGWIEAEIESWIDSRLTSKNGGGHE